MKLQTDKLLHFSIAYGATLTLCMINPWLAVLVVLASIGKEVLDWFKYGKKIGWSEFRKMMFGDLISDGIGIIMGIILVTGVRVWTIR